VQAHEVRNQLERFESIWTLGIATVDYKSFAPTITPTDADLAKFFSENPERYEIQPQVSVRYAEFPSYEFIDKVTATEAEIKAYYNANPARFNKPEAKADDKKPATPAKPADFASVSLQVELAFKLERAARLATKAASDFTFELFQKKIVPGTPAFAELLASHKIVLKDLAPFSQEEPPVELGRSPEAANEAFKLGKERLYSDAIALTTGSAVLFWKENLPARQPLLTEVKAKVSADYVENEKEKRFVELGKTLRVQIQTRLKAGDTFDKAVAAVSGASPVKLEGKTLAPFTLRQRPQDLDYSVLNSLESLKKGEVSDMVVGQDKGLLVYAADKKSPDLSEANPQYKNFNLQLARGTAARNSGEYLREIVEAELAKSAPATAP
jgi:peptidyl-prolyl cis-trans isomerase D